MKKMRDYLTFKVKKIPIPFAFLLGLFGLIGGILIINKGQVFFLGASGEYFPHNIKIANIGSTSLTVSWTTEKEATGSVVYSQDSSFNESQNDVRDESQAKQQKYITHFVTIENLNPQTKYSFKIISEGKYYDLSGKPFAVTTASAKLPPDADLAQGRIFQPDNQPANGAIVYLSLPNTVVQAGLTDSEGHWMIPLASARTVDLQSFSNYDRSAQIEEIFVQGESLTSSATLITNNDNPAPDIILGQIYNFQKETPATPTSSPANASSDEISQQKDNSGFQEIETGEENLTILFPSQDENVNSLTPEFFGNGPKNTPLTVEVQSPEKISSQTEVDKNGRWQWSPSRSLTPGSHTVTVSFVDKDGFVQKLSRSFVVLATGTSDLPSFTATRSGEISPTIAKTPTSTAVTATPKILPSTTPTVTPKITSTGATPTADSARTTIPSGTPPRSGTSLPTLIFLGGGITVIIIGIVLLLL